MKGTKDIRFNFIVAVLVITMASGQNMYQATGPSKEVESAAAQASVDPVNEAETPSDPPDIADYMDEAAAKQFEPMNDEWQGMARYGWVRITKKFTPDAPGDWPDDLEEMLSQVYAQAKI